MDYGITYKKIKKLSTKLPIKLYKEIQQNQERKTSHAKTILTPHSHTIFDILPQHVINNASSTVKHNTTSPIIQNIHLNKYHIAAISTASIVLFYCAYQKKIQEKLDSFKKHNKKNLIRDNLKDIAHLSKKEFQLITPKRLEELFLPHNLDLINDLYTYCEGKNYGEFYVGDDFYQGSMLSGSLYSENTLLSLACKYDNFEVCAWLLKNGADTNIRGERKNTSYVIGDSPLLHCLHMWRNPEKLEKYIQLLLHHKANFEVYSYIDLLPKIFFSCTKKIYYSLKSGFTGTVVGRLLNNVSCQRYNNEKNCGCKEACSCGCISKCKYYRNFNFCYIHDPSPLYNCIKLLIKNGAILYHQLNTDFFSEEIPFVELFQTIDHSNKIYNYLDSCGGDKLELLASIFEELFFEGFDPSKKVIDANLPLILSVLLYDYAKEKIEVPEGSGNFKECDVRIITKDPHDDNISIKECFQFARTLLAYGHATKNLISTYKDALLNKLEILSIYEGEIVEGLKQTIQPQKIKYFFDNFNTIFDILVDEEYEFRKAFLENPQELFLQLLKRCKRPELWIKRIKNEIGISPAQQNKITWQICSQTLSLLYNMMQGEKSDFVMDDLAKTSMFLVEKISASEGKTDFDKSVRKLTAKILLDTVHKLHEGSDTLYKSTKPLIDCLFEHPNVVNWLKKKEGKNILHVLALNCINANKFLQKIEKYTENNRDEKLRDALKQPMNSSFTHDTHTTPLYTATQQLEIDDTCRETVDLLEKIEKNLNADKNQNNSLSIVKHAQKNILSKNILD